jgi:hypothetical protein
MIALTVGLLLSLATSGASANGTTQPPESAPVMIAMSSPDTDVAALATLTQVSSTAPVLATDALLIKPVVKPVIKPVKRTEPTIFFAPRSWFIMTAVQHSSATFDAWSTRYSITSGRGHELNPLMKPFAGSGAIYGMIQLAPMATDYLGRRLMNSKHPTLRKLWWVPQAAGSAGFMISSINNIRVGSR